MASIDFYVSGLSVALALFLLAVNTRAYRRSGIRMFAYLMVVFVVLLADGLIVLATGIGLFSLPISTTSMLLISNIVILILFYIGVVRGSQ